MAVPSQPPRSTPRPFRVLLVEDNPADARLVREALRDAAVPVAIDVAPDGETALALLRRASPSGGPGSDTAALPDVVLLDQVLPGISGLETLIEMQRHPVLRMIPTFLITGFTEPGLEERAAAAGAVGFLIKPLSETNVRNVVSLLERLMRSVHPEDAN